MVTGKITTGMVRVYLLVKTEPDTMVTGKTIKSTAKV